MPQYDKYNNVGLKRMAFKYGSSVVTLAINPQNYEYQETQRATTIKTQSDNVIEQYGPDFPTITFSGHTGYNKNPKGYGTSKNASSGKKRFDTLMDLITGYQAREVDGAAKTGDLYFYNYTDDKSYTVTIPSGGFQYSRSVDTPLLFNYSISLVVLSGSNVPARNTVVNPIIGTGTGSSVTTGADADTIANSGDNTVATTSSSIAMGYTKAMENLGFNVR